MSLIPNALRTRKHENVLERCIWKTRRCFVSCTVGKIGNYDRWKVLRHITRAKLGVTNVISIIIRDRISYFASKYLSEKSRKQKTTDNLGVA